MVESKLTIGRQRGTDNDDACVCIRTSTINYRFTSSLADRRSSAGRRTQSGRQRAVIEIIPHPKNVRPIIRRRPCGGVSIIEVVIGV